MTTETMAIAAENERIKKEKIHTQYTATSHALWRVRERFAVGQSKERCNDWLQEHLLNAQLIGGPQLQNNSLVVYAYEKETRAKFVLGTDKNEVITVYSDRNYEITEKFMNKYLGALANPDSAEGIVARLEMNKYKPKKV